MPGIVSTGAWTERVAEAVPFARRLPGFGALAGLTGALPPPRPPETFSIRCPCGGTVAGTRSERERTEPCPQCGDAVFVLPADVYPAPPAERTTVPPSRRTAAAPKPTKRRSTKEPKANRPPPVPWRTRLAGAANRAKTGAKRQATPLRLIAVGLAAVIAGTAWWGVIQSRQAAARVTVAEAPAEAAEALADGRFAVAAERFEALADAYATLGRTEEPRALGARQNAREATAAAGLASQTPAEIARQAAAVRTAADRTDWARTFDGLYRGRWVILDVHVARLPAPAVYAPTREERDEEGERDAAPPAPPPDRVELLYPLAIAGTRFRLIGDPAVPSDLSVGDDPRRVLLAGRYAECVRVPDGRGGTLWELRLEPGSAFLWTGTETLSAVGFDLTGPEGAAVRTILAEQAVALGLPAEGASPDDPTDPATNDLEANP